MAKKESFTKDTKVWRQMKANLRRGKSSISVGWFEGQHYGSDNGFLPMAQVAQWVEEGHVNGGMFKGTYTPPRPAIRTIFIPVIAEAKEFRQAALPYIHQVAMGKISWKQLHTKLAPEVLHIFKETLRSYNVVKNSPVTISMKGFNDPWKDTGVLIHSAEYRVEGYKLFSSKNYQPQMLQFA